MIPFVAIHQPKSQYAYPYDENTIHLRLDITKGHATRVRVLFGDPFHWGPSDDGTGWEWQIEAKHNSQMIHEFTTETFDHFFFAATPKTKRMRYAFLVDDRYLVGCRETVDLTKFPSKKTDHFNYFNFPFINEEDIYRAPSWVKDQVWYSIFPERFANGDPSINLDDTLSWGETDKYSNRQHFGGDLQGIIDHLDYITEMGFTGLYMTPIFPSDSTHKYDVNDYYGIDPAFGNKDTFRTLVEEAHARGLKVMLDAVYNHCGFRHPYFQDVITHGKDSKYYDCFYIIDTSKPLLSFDVNEDGTINRQSAKAVFQDKSLLNYRTFSFTPYMPKMRTTHPLMKEYLLGAATYWIREFDIDGWRLDVSDEVAHTFWREFRQVVKAENEDAYIIGENWSNSIPWLHGDQYDGVMNYELLFPMWDFFGCHKERTNITPSMFKNHVNHVLTQYPKHVLQNLYNLLDSHDTTRIMQICDNDTSRVKLPYLFLFSFPGSPSVYYGGEIGLSGEHDPDNRRCMPWDESLWDTDLQAFLKTLISIRKQHESFRSVAFKWILADDPTNTIVYQKQDTIFILNVSPESSTIMIPSSIKGTYTNLFTNDEVVLEKKLTLPPFGYLVVQQQSNKKEAN